MYSKFKAVYQLKSIGEFSSLKEAFKVIYDAIKAEKVLMWQMLETTIWIEHGRDVYPFYEARDIMCKAGWLVDGKWVETGTPAESRYGRDVEPEPKPLAQYLGEYIEHELADNVNIHTFCELLGQALDAYESTEQVKIRIERKIK